MDPKKQPVIPIPAATALIMPKDRFLIGLSTSQAATLVVLRHYYPSHILLVGQDPEDKNAVQFIVVPPEAILSISSNKPFMPPTPSPSTPRNA